MDNINIMLQNVAHAVDKSEQIAIIKGERFNLFRILDRSTDEVKAHSAFIGELLNPMGVHGMGNSFQKIFFELILSKASQIKIWVDEGLNQSFDFELLNKYGMNVNVECDVGKIDGDKGGRIDILLKANNHAICIENKIYAGDQELQLRRYFNYLQQFDKRLLIYLTLDGNEAGIISTTTYNYLKNPDQGQDENSLKADKDYICLSYKYEILEWLKSCYELSIEQPILRESIKQYIIIIKELTKQLISPEMINEVHKQILNNLRGAETVANEFNSALKAVSEQLRIKVIEKLNLTFLDTKIDNNNWRNILGVWIYHTKAVIGIESFNGLGHQNGSLYIGKVHFIKQEGFSYTNKIWVDGSIEKIWNDKAEVFDNLQKFANGSEEEKDRIADTIAKEVIAYISRIHE